MVQALFHDTKLRVAALQIGFVVLPGVFWLLLSDELFFVVWPTFATSAFVLLLVYFNARAETKGELVKKLSMTLAAHFLIGVGIVLLVLTATVSQPLLGAFAIACALLGILVAVYHIDLV